jgi:hypothetical protein
MKTIDTLVADMKHVLTTGEGYTSEIRDWVAGDIAKSLDRQLGSSEGLSKPRLRMSGLGTPCDRRLWYTINRPSDREPLPANTKFKFLYGDLIESLTLGLAKAAGHSVTGLQGSVEIAGIRGSRDAIIDGVLIDVKSANDRSMQKFRDNGLRDGDPFGYLSQLSSYLFASQDDDLLTEKNKAGFLVVDKNFGHIELHIYDLSDLMENKLQEVENKKQLVKAKKPPPKAFDPVPDGKSGNMKLATNCSYCDFKYTCWPEARTFLYSNGPRYLTKVEREPSAWEVK